MKMMVMDGDEEDDDEDDDDARVLIWLRERHGMAPGTPPTRGRIDLGASGARPQDARGTLGLTKRENGSAGHSQEQRKSAAGRRIPGTPVATGPTQTWRPSARFRTERPARVPSDAVFNKFDEADRAFALSESHAALYQDRTQDGSVSRFDELAHRASCRPTRRKLGRPQSG